jgi:hypothetical protein
MTVNVEQGCDHEVSHAIVALRLGFDRFTHVFVDLVTPRTDRRGGLDMVIEELRAQFDTEVPQAERQALAVQLRAVFAAGSEGERLREWIIDPNWSAWDEEQIEYFGIVGVYADEDLQLFEKSKARDNGWDKWGRVDEVIAEGRESAARILKTNIGPLRESSRLLQDSVAACGRGRIALAQLKRSLGIM